MSDSSDPPFEPATPDDESDTHNTGDDAPFGPVPLRYRHDGWTPERQQAFIEALAGCGCVDAACRALGRSRAAIDAG